jgi:hypothetical protein
MAAGLGFKTFTTGEVLTAADVNGYLNSQTVMVFADTAARSAAITSPQEGMFSYLKDTNVTQYYTGSAWANLDTTGMTNPMTTTGDTIYSSSGSTPARLGIGTSGQVLTVDSGIPAWQTISAGGMTLISETVASSLSSLSFSSLGSYKQLLLIWAGIRHSASGSAFSIRLNNNSGSIYPINGFQGDSTFTLNATLPSSIQGSNNINIYPFGESVTNAASGTDVYGSLLVDNYTSTTKSKYWEIKNGYYYAPVSYGSLNCQGLFDSTSAITSLDIVRLSGSATFSNQGNTTIRLYGVS